MNAWVVVLIAGCSGANGDGSRALCECTSSDDCTMSTTINGPPQCQSDADCKPGEACTELFADTFQCSPVCNWDGSGCPIGYRCQMFVP
jgi:hypothetical protein